MPKGKKIIQGRPSSPGQVVARVRIVNGDLDKKEKLQPGEIMVAERTTPEDTIYMGKAVAFITNLGGTLCHAAIVAREMGKPAVTGTTEATEVLKDGQMVLVDGNEGAVYEWIPEEGKEEKGENLADKMARLAKEKGITISPEFIEKMKRRE